MFPDYFVAPQTLERRLAYLTRHFRVINLDEAVRQLQQGRLAPRQVVLTFDDGDVSFLKKAIPVLRRWKTPATVYVVSCGLMQRTLALNVAVRELFLRTKQTTVSGELFEDGQSRSLDSPDQSRRCAALAVEAMNRMEYDYSVRRNYAMRIATALSLDWGKLFDDQHWDYMIAEEVRQCVDAGFDVQLHSDKHRTTIEMKEGLSEDTALCRRRIEEVTGREARDYCYPSGLWTHECWQPLREAGVRSAVTCRNGPNFPETPILALRRYVDGESITQLEFEALVSGFCWYMNWWRGRAHRSQPTEAISEDGLYY